MLGKKEWKTKIRNMKELPVYGRVTSDDLFRKGDLDNFSWASIAGRSFCGGMAQYSSLGIVIQEREL